ncbi:hypothetical protein RvY_13545 [Ramazzottius varieornatus]|uniref:Uncharacterized protein n=1 Tax=Ramazzottius varieornatus TaxID=947166 RepID=A0A1D1VSA0_RAMVA|nr:hypothetical protein RvY_13545 [Ramazzottius varieornatus]
MEPPKPELSILFQRLARRKHYQGQLNGPPKITNNPEDGRSELRTSSGLLQPTKQDLLSE